MENTTPVRKFPSIFDMAILLLLFFVSQMVFGSLLKAFGIVPPETSVVDSVDTETYMNEQIALGRYIAVIYPLSMLLSIASIWLYVRFRSGKGSIRMRHSARGLNPSIVFVGIVWLLSAQIVLEPLMSVLPPSESRGLGRGAWACFTAVISSAVLEELLCRGLIFETFRKRWGIKTSILFSSLFFGLIHLDVATMVVAVVAGIIFGVLYVRTASLYTTIIIHSINNAMAFALICFGVGDISLREIIGDGIPYYVAYGVAAVIFLTASIEAYISVFRQKNKTQTK